MARLNYSKPLKRLQLDNSTTNIRLAKLVGASQASMVTQWRTTGRISEAYRQKICEVFNISMSEFTAMAEKEAKDG